MTADELHVGFAASSDLPGVTIAAVVAVAEVIDADGDRHYVTLTSNGMTPTRKARLIEHLDNDEPPDAVLVPVPA